MMFRPKFLIFLVTLSYSAHFTVSATDGYFPSPNKVKCSLPLVRVVHYEEEPINFRQGVCGEKCLKRTMDIFQSCKGEGVKVLNMRESSDNGIDYFIVDEIDKRIVFLEAKGADFKPLFKAKGDIDLHDVILGRNDTSWQHAIAMERIKIKAEGLLKVGKQPADQLSRSWCEERVNRLETSNETEKLKKALQDDTYKFMRLLSLTITSNNDISNRRAITYYMVVNDGDSDRPLTTNPKHRISITDGGVTNIVEEKELAPNASELYCKHMCGLLEGEIAIKFIPLLVSTRTDFMAKAALSQNVLAEPNTHPTLQPDPFHHQSQNLFTAAAYQPSLTPTLVVGGALSAADTGEEDYSYLSGLSDAEVALALSRHTTKQTFTRSESHLYPSTVMALQPTTVSASAESSNTGTSTTLNPPLQVSLPSPLTLNVPTLVVHSPESPSSPNEVVVVDEESVLNRKRQRDGE